MPVTRLKDETSRILHGGRNTVACRVSHEALRDHADRMHYAGPDALFSTRTEN